MTKVKCNVEVFSRVTGFFRPVQSWNKGKTEEFKDRKRFHVETITEKDDSRRTSETLTC